MQDSTNFPHLPSPPSHYPTDSYTRVNSTARTEPDSSSPPQTYDHENFQHYSNFSRQPSNITPAPSMGIPPPSHYPNDNYPSENIHQPPPPHNSEQPIYHHQSHPNQPYQPEPQFPVLPTLSYPNFQSYPSFAESSLPAAPSHFPSYYQGSDASYTGLPPNTTTYASTPQYNSSGNNGKVPEVSHPKTEKYEYDSSYQPPPEKIAEAHKAARFAVGALAFDDVSTAIQHLKKSLEMLTNPSAGQ